MREHVFSNFCMCRWFCQCLWMYVFKFYIPLHVYTWLNSRIHIYLFEFLCIFFRFWKCLCIYVDILNSNCVPSLFIHFKLWNRVFSWIACICEWFWPCVLLNCVFTCLNCLYMNSCMNVYLWIYVCNLKL